MNTQPLYIKRVEIYGLWGSRNISWELTSDVNVLSGINGSGKSTTLECLYTLYKGTIASDYVSRHIKGMKVVANTGLSLVYRDGMIYKVSETIEQAMLPADFTLLHSHLGMDMISSFDRPLIGAEDIRRLSDNRVATDLDWKIYKLQKAYLDYQVNLGKEAFSIFSDHSSAADKSDKVSALMQKKETFLDILDKLFEQTGKKVDRTKNEIAFLCGEEEILPHQLSAGEKQILAILLTVLIQNNKHCILLLDEPEISLHFEWQRQLIDLIRQLNGNAQIILATHSPAVIMDGWSDKVTEVFDVTTLMP
ncbi:MAG TPA: ABC transporter ATP-binding protein [Porphyromonadaceae bacterium]|nr:ABC transporter ATP-binding protein [Porphyromonadaceae bacterium]